MRSTYVLIHRHILGPSTYYLLWWVQAGLVDKKSILFTTMSNVGVKNKKLNAHKTNDWHRPRKVWIRGARASAMIRSRFVGGRKNDLLHLAHGWYRNVLSRCLCRTAAISAAIEYLIQKTQCIKYIWLQLIKPSEISITLTANSRRKKYQSEQLTRLNLVSCFEKFEFFLIDLFLFALPSDVFKFSSKFIKSSRSHQAQILIKSDQQFSFHF